MLPYSNQINDKTNFISILLDEKRIVGETLVRKTVTGLDSVERQYRFFLCFISFCLKLIRRNFWSIQVKWSGYKGILTLSHQTGINKTLRKEKKKAGCFWILNKRGKNVVMGMELWL